LEKILKQVYQFPSKKLFLKRIINLLKIKIIKQQKNLVNLPPVKKDPQQNPKNFSKIGFTFNP